MHHPPMTLEEYRTVTRGLSRPARAQLEAFALYVSQAHSWYKKLPVAPPGRPFCFYIDPYAGMDIVQKAADGFVVAPRPGRGFHYNQLPTAEHRQRLGYLAFCSGGREMVPDGLKHIDGLRVPAGGAPMLYDPRVRDFRLLPGAVVDAGIACFSSIVHEYIVGSGRLSMYVLGNIDTRVEREVLENCTPAWPEESGGQAILERLRERLSGASPTVRDARVADLLAPERRRQHLGMIHAVERVLRLIDGGPATG